MDDAMRELKKEEVETEKKKLSDIRAMSAETKEKIKRIEDECNEHRILHQKKIRNLRNLLTSHDTRLAKLIADTKLVSNVTASRREELKNLIKINEDSVAELMKVQDETEMNELKKRVSELERDIKQGYIDLQNEKEIQVLLEVGLSNVKDETRIPLTSLESILKKRQECMKQRQEEMNKEVREIEQEQAALEVEIKEKQDKLVALKDTYIDLVHSFNKTRNGNK